MSKRYTSAYLLLLITTTTTVLGDIYLHNPRGSNNRLNEATRPRRNANRMFDSQNNQRGGYNVGEDSLHYYTGSQLTIEWTNQHSCAEKNSHCELVLQYMCGDSLRDGTLTGRIPSKKSDCGSGDCNTDTRYGMHEDYDYYMDCLYRERNKGLFTVNKINRASAIGTRQNPQGNRYAYECPEERDYYPYWHPTPWIDIAVLTNDVNRCDMYQRESQNVKSRFSCVPPAGYIDDVVNKRVRWKLLPTNKEACEEMVHPPGSTNTFVWTETKAWSLPPPECRLGPRNRDNHLGNGVGGFANMYNWTIPDRVSDHCVLRIRYNISTGDYDAWKTNKSTEINIGKLVGIDDKNEADSRDFRLRNNPQVQILKKSIGGVDVGAKLKLQLAINTAQYGRTFQDRSHSFSIRKRPENVKQTKIHNVNVRGKRGNIVQVYPAVEYDYVPNRLMASVGDGVHFQWTGSDTNPRNNDGQGRRGTDRSNIALLRPQNYPEGKPKPKGTVFGHWGNNYPVHLDNVTFLGFTRADLEKLMVLKPGESGLSLSELDDGGAYFDMGVRSITSSGTFYYMCTRNNNFSNRSQKGKVVVGAVAFVEKVVGWSGGEVALDHGKQGVWIEKGAVRASKRIHVEEWNEKDGSEMVTSQGGYINVGEKYESNFLAVYPFDAIVDEEQEATIKIQVQDADVGVYHSLDFVHWRRVKDVNVQGSAAMFKSTKGGVFVARKNSSGQTHIVAGVVVVLVVVVLVVGTVMYCRSRDDGRGNPRRVINEITNNFRDEL